VEAGIDGLLADKKKAEDEAKKQETMAVEAKKKADDLETKLTDATKKADDLETKLTDATKRLTTWARNLPTPTTP